MMVSTLRQWTGWLAVALVAGALVPETPAQQPDTDVRVRRLTVSRQKTPQYNLRTGSSAASAVKDWVEIRLDYDTRPDWMDALDITWFALVKNPPEMARQTGQQFTLFKGDIGYANIARGRHAAVAFLHPSTVSRYGVPEAVAVVISAQGRVLAIESNQAGGQRWWERFAPVEGFVLNRMQTPFAMVNFDDYEMIRSTPAAPR